MWYVSVRVFMFVFKRARLFTERRWSRRGCFLVEVEIRGRVGTWLCYFLRRLGGRI